MLIARRVGLDAELVQALNEDLVVGAVGPTCRAILEAHGVEPDVVPEHPKMGPLVVALMRHLDQHGGGAFRSRLGLPPRVALQ
jgi:uroporphyrinogen-III synthase